MRVIFMGSPDFAVTELLALHAAGHDIVAVYTQPPRPAGRGKKDRPSAVEREAARLGLPVRHPVSLKGGAEQQDFADLQADIAVVVAYGLILPRAVLDAPRLGCWNIHASLLPRWRGAAPIHRAIMAGDRKTGVSIMGMEAGLDTGPVLRRESVPITDDLTTGVLHDTLAALGARMIVDALPVIEAGAETDPQPQTGVTYAAKIEKAEARINWSRPAAQVSAHIRGLSPFPGAWSELDGERIKILNCAVDTGADTPGTILNDTLTIACGLGAIRVTYAQRAGKAALNVADLLLGYDAPKGARFQ